MWGLNLHIKHEKTEAEKNREKTREKKKAKEIKKNNKIK